MKRSIRHFACAIFIFTSLSVFSSEKLTDAEKAVLNKISDDLSLMSDILNKTSGYLNKDPATVSLAELLESINELEGGDVIYFSTPLARNGYFKDCLIGGSYRSIERFGNSLNQYEINKNSINRDVLIVEMRHIRKIIETCQSEISGRYVK